MTRAANMQALTADVKRQWPGVVVYGVGDTAHQSRASDHNEDDTSGSKAAQSDPDGRPEHRAIDIMLGKAFTKADADALVARLVADPRARARLFYVIWNGYIWSRSNGWKKVRYTGSDQHTDHVHASGWAADDENTASWPAVATKGDDMALTTDELARLKRVETDAAWLRDYVYRALNGQAKASGGENIELQKWVREGQADRKAILAALAALSGRDFTDEPAIVAGVLASLTPEAIAAAIPPTMAQQVVDELTARLAE
ncbi:hypothetical protein [Micromonospora tarensis]|uniref:ARB-07466-like C-terminal domain-containing protein n=1 Tax=Micromonospora tarensis TaxID=2806100 RepID=A0ABS1YD25_9ACTN|nr:hypothetical protein [Micromonospora tarensis]MBM0275316.1 hypothetical protein [Micromonospora tarensis]